MAGFFHIPRIKKKNERERGRAKGTEGWEITRVGFSLYFSFYVLPWHLDKA